MNTINVKPNSFNGSNKDSSSGGLPSFLSTFLLVLIIVVVLIGGAFLYFRDKYYTTISETNSDNPETVALKIEQGENLDSIAKKLVKKEVLQEDRSRYFRMYMVISGNDAKVQAGEFEIPKNLSIEELALALQEAGVPDVWITIPEGLRYDEVASTIDNAYKTHEETAFSKEEFMSYFDNETKLEEHGLGDYPTFEGFLFPSRYRFPKEATASYVLDTLVNQFKAEVGDYSYEELIIASLIEREAKNDEQRYIISDIIHKRIDEGWFLGIDAANLYYHGDWSYTLTQQDLELDHPYNTRVNLGLPPTPISNPGLASIKAAKDPVDTEYYYYIHDENNVMYPARTSAEHEQNIAEHLN